jgi:hypothetical protein
VPIDNEDLRNIVTEGGNVTLLYGVIKKTFKSPPLPILNYPPYTEEEPLNPTALLKIQNKDLAVLVENWITEKTPQITSTYGSSDFKILAALEYGKNFITYLERAIN